MKKSYTSPKLIHIGDMVNNTLGSSGTVADSGTRQASVYGKQSFKQNQGFDSTWDKK